MLEGSGEPMGVEEDLNICCWSSECYLVLSSATGLCRGAGCLSHTQTMQSWVSSTKFTVGFVSQGSTEQVVTGLGWCCIYQQLFACWQEKYQLWKVLEESRGSCFGYFCGLTSSLWGGAAVGCGPGTCHSVSSARCAPAARGPRAGAAVSMAAAILSSQ